LDLYFVARFAPSASNFYRAMQILPEHGYATVSHLSVSLSACLSVCNVQVP